jgi:hypothetical protein
LQLNAYGLRKRKPKVEIPEQKELPSTNDAVLFDILKIDWQKEQLKDKVLQNRKDSKFFVTKKGVVYRQGTRNKIYVPSHLVEKVIQEVHNHPLVAHGGREQMKYHLRDYWFPSFESTVNYFCRNCIEGIGEKFNVLSTRKPLPILERLYIDIVGPLENDTDTYDNEFRYILTMLDDGSRFLRAVAIPNRTSDVVLEALMTSWIGIFGPPKQITYDNDKSFLGDVINLLKEK